MIGFFVFISVVIIGYLVFGRKPKNPYIDSHKQKWKNESDYKEYLKWLSDNGGDVPFPELKLNHEVNYPLP